MSGTDETPTGPRVRVWPGRVARVLSGVLVLALTGGAVALARTLPDASTGATTTPDAVAVAPSAATLVCPGPLQLPDDSSAGGSEFDRVPVDPVERVSGFAAGSTGDAALTTLDGAARSVDLGSGSAALASPTAPVVLRADPVDDQPARVAGATSSLVTDGDLRGLSTAACARPSSDVWLVGGSTVLESTADLVIVNAGATAADVTVELWGPNGAVDLGAGGTLLVAPGAERVVVLAAVAAEQRRVVVHVQAAGGQISAYLQDSALDGFTPQGTDLVTAGTAPAQRQVVPGVVLTATDVDSADAGALRLLVPGDTDATASVTLVGPDGAQPLTGAQDLRLVAGEVTDISLGGLPAGGCTAVVDSSAPVVASAMTARAGRAGELDEVARVDRAWSAATPTGAGLVAVPSGATGSLVLAAVADPDAEPDATAATADGTTGAADGTTPTAGATSTPTTGATDPPASDGAGADAATGDAATDGSPTPTTDPTGSAAAASTLRVTLRPYGSAGALDEVEVEVPAGSSLTVPVADLGTGVTGVEVVPDDLDGVTLSWALLATAVAPDGPLLSVVAPLVDQAGTTEALVQQGRRVGLG